MKKLLEKYINRHYKEELKLLFGEDSYVKVENIIWSTNEKKYVVNSKLYVKEIKDSIEAFPEGLDYLITEGWKIIGDPNKPVMINTIDVIKN